MLLVSFGCRCMMMRLVRCVLLLRGIRVSVLSWCMLWCVSMLCNRVIGRALSAKFIAVQLVVRLLCVLGGCSVMWMLLLSVWLLTGSVCLTLVSV